MEFCYKSSDSLYPHIDTANVNPGEWAYLSAVFDSSSTSLFINGQLAETRLTAGTIQVTQDSLYIANIYYYGQIDEVRLSNTARSPEMIKLNFETQKEGSTVVRIED